MKTFKIGGIHPSPNKITANDAIRPLNYTGDLYIMLSQSIGKPAIPTVKAGQEVKAGEIIAQADGFVSAPLHSPVDGTVKKIDKVPTPQGFTADAIIITPADEQQPLSDHESAGTLPEASEIAAIIGNAGIVGLGGAAFPTKVKLTPPQGMVPTTVLLNGAECEPWLTCDDRLMREQSKKVALGGELIMKAVGVDKCYIGIEANKPEAIAAMRQAASGIVGMEVVELKTKYPQGGEKELITAIMGVDVPSGALPVSVGAIVDNVATAAAIYDAVYLGHPLTRRIITVTGPGLKNPGNFLVNIGTPISALIEAAGGLPEDTGKVIAGGPMMGRAISNLNAPTVKGMSGLLVLPRSMSSRRKEENCIRCARCLDACPMGLEPYLLIAQARHNRWADMKASLALNCIECGSCQYICPASKPILDYIKLGKTQIRKL